MPHRLLVARAKVDGEPAASLPVELLRLVTGVGVEVGPLGLLPWVSVSRRLTAPAEDPGGQPAPAVPPRARPAVVAPATFNTVNKWAAGITDTFATGLLCELMGVGVPILAVPLVKDALARHVAFGRSLDLLRGMGVHVLFDPDAPPQARMPSWQRVLNELHRVMEVRVAGEE